MLTETLLNISDGLKIRQSSWAFHLCAWWSFCVSQNEGIIIYLRFLPSCTVVVILLYLRAEMTVNISNGTEVHLSVHRGCLYVCVGINIRFENHPRFIKPPRCRTLLYAPHVRNVQTSSPTLGGAHRRIACTVFRIIYIIHTSNRRQFVKLRECFAPLGRRHFTSTSRGFPRTPTKGKTPNAKRKRRRRRRGHNRANAGGENSSVRRTTLALVVVKPDARDVHGSIPHCGGIPPCWMRPASLPVTPTQLCGPLIEGDVSADATGAPSGATDHSPLPVWSRFRHGKEVWQRGEGQSIPASPPRRPFSHSITNCRNGARGGDGHPKLCRGRRRELLPQGILSNACICDKMVFVLLSNFLDVYTIGSWGRTL